MASWSACATTFEQEILPLMRAQGGTQQYPYPSHVNPFGIVSIKLSGRKNYNPWQEQMVCLIESHGMQGFIDGRFKNPNDNDDSQSSESETTKYEKWKRSDSLVKGWIFGSLNENVMCIVVGHPTAMDVWKKLNTTYATHNKEIQQYPYPSHVRPKDFLSTQLYGQNNYNQWLEQMECLIESHGMQGFIDGSFKNPKENIYDSQNKEGETTKYEEWKRSDSLVKGWIFGSLSEDVMDVVVGIPTAMDVWKKLNTTYSTDNKGTQHYPYPSHVQPNDFVSIVLSGEENYIQWRGQMECLLESHGMRGFIEGGQEYHEHIDGITNKEWKRSDSLVEEWIFSSLNEIIKEVVYGLSYRTAKDVWDAVNSFHDPLTTREDKGLAQHIALHRAIVQGDWDTARRHFDEDQNALTVKLNRWGHRPLHVAIRTNAKIEFLRKLLNEINPESLPSIVDNYGFTPLHHAAVAGYHEAAKMLVDINPKLLFVSDNFKCLPLSRAAYFPKKKMTFRYLYEASVQHIQLSQAQTYYSPFEGRNQAELLDNLLYVGILDVAYDLIKKDPVVATVRFSESDPLSCIAGNLELYYSGTHYNFYQRFIYSHVPIDDMEEGDTTDSIQDVPIETASRCWRSCFHTGLLQFNFNYSSLHYFIQRIYVKFWKITLLHVPHIKQLKEDKVKHNTALILLRFICQEVGKLCYYSDIEERLYMAIHEATRNNTIEAIKEIIMHFPQAYNLTRHFLEYNMIQLAIKNRSEKVYNLLVHDTSTKNLINKAGIDKDRNTLLHLAGELAPIHKINVVSGAALQMQRELQWFKEVEKLVDSKRKKEKNKKQETPFMMFRREHLQLRKEGEEWMKKTADSYTLTAILIVTIVFAAAITVPGGNNDTGKAVYATKTSFTIFAVSDAISLFTSTTSLLLFLSILTTRYRDEDFLYKLPTRLILGLVMLFLSVTFLMVAFSATLYLAFGQEKAWILIPIAALTCLPITSFVTLQFPLLVELISSTYGSGIFGKNK